MTINELRALLVFSLFCCCVQYRNVCQRGREIRQRACETLQVRDVAMSAFGKPPACATARFSDRSAVGIASYSIRYCTALQHANADQTLLACPGSSDFTAGFSSPLFGAFGELTHTFEWSLNL
jgi:hypothetical protein